MKVYSFYDREETRYFVTVPEAVREAQQAADFLQDPVTIDVTEIRKDLPLKKLMVMLLNGTGWAKKFEEYRVIHPQKDG